MTVETSNTWVDKFRTQSNSDAELQAHGKFYSCSFLLDMQEHRYLVRMHRGKVEEILVDPSDLDERYQFVIRASADTWRKFSQPTPPRHHNRLRRIAGPRGSTTHRGQRPLRGISTSTQSIMTYAESSIRSMASAVL
jgi:hypothetical protein